MVLFEVMASCRRCAENPLIPAVQISRTISSQRRFAEDNADWHIEGDAENPRDRDDTFDSKLIAKYRHWFPNSYDIWARRELRAQFITKTSRSAGIRTTRWESRASSGAKTRSGEQQAHGAECLSCVLKSTWWPGAPSSFECGNADHGFVFPKKNNKHTSRRNRRRVTECPPPDRLKSRSAMFSPRSKRRVNRSLPLTYRWMVHSASKWERPALP